MLFPAISGNFHQFSAIFSYFQLFSSYFELLFSYFVIAVSTGKKVSSFEEANRFVSLSIFKAAARLQQRSSNKLWVSFINWLKVNNNCMLRVGVTSVRIRQVSPLFVLPSLSLLKWVSRKMLVEKKTYFRQKANFAYFDKILG